MAMNEAASLELGALFRAVGQVFIQQRESLNRGDPYNANHGDHMVEIFQIAAKAADEQQGSSLAEAMESASQLLLQADNGSARVYAHGLSHFAQQFRKYDITLADLIAYVRGLFQEKSQEESAEAAQASPAPAKAGEVLKALLAGLAGWQATEDGQPVKEKTLDVGYLFDLGVTYMQAKQRGGSKAEVLADAAASISPLGRVPHRYQSGKLAIQSLLEEMAKLAAQP